MTPTLTVIIPTINRPTLQRAVRSVERQTRWTPIVVQYDHHERTGTGPTINRALKHVKTPWVATMGDDDTLHPMYCELLEKVLEEDAANPAYEIDPRHPLRGPRRLAPLDMVIFRMEYPDGSRLPLATRPEDLEFGQVGCSYAVRTDVAREVGFIDRPCTPVLAEDWEMIQGVRARGGRIKIVHRVVYFVRHDPHHFGA